VDALEVIADDRYTKAERAGFDLSLVDESLRIATEQ
jgi:hypothetical protein